MPSERNGEVAGNKRSRISLASFLRPKIIVSVNPREQGRAVVGGLLISAFLFALALAGSPLWHARLHPDAGSPNHECAVTLITAGKAEQANSAPVLIAPQPALVFATVPEFATVWVPASFSRAAVLEHAPPTLS